MSGDAHTPGPWQTKRNISSVAVYDQQGGAIARLSLVDACRSAEKQAANARLISAAPELLEALKAICDEQNANEGYAAPATYDAARAVIAKAEAQQ